MVAKINRATIAHPATSYHLSPHPSASCPCPNKFKCQRGAKQTNRLVITLTIPPPSAFNLSQSCIITSRIFNCSVVSWHWWCGGDTNTERPQRWRNYTINDDMRAWQCETHVITLTKQCVQRAQNPNTDDILMLVDIESFFKRKKPTWYLVSWVKLGAVMSGLM